MEFISDRVPCVTLKGRWCDIIVLNAHDPSEDKDDDIKDSFYEEIEQLFDQLPMYHMIRNVLTRRREYGTYLATARRHRRRIKMQQ